MVDGEQEWEVEKIVDERNASDEELSKNEHSGYDIRYRVRWKGWPPCDDTWISAEDAQPLGALDECIQID